MRDHNPQEESQCSSREVAVGWFVLHKLQVFSLHWRVASPSGKGCCSRGGEGWKWSKMAQVTAVQGGNCWCCIGCVLVLCLGVVMDVNREEATTTI